jgi:hypothetical protein
VDSSFRFCPWCAAPLRRKLVEFFPGSGVDAHRAVRVSRYLDEERVRVSVWDESGRAEAAIWLDADEAERLAAFVSSSPCAPDEAPTLAGL